MSLHPCSLGSGGRGARRAWTVCASSSMTTGLTVDDLELHVVDVDGVRVGRGVVDLPGLGRPHRGVLGHGLAPRPVDQWPAASTVPSIAATSGGPRWVQSKRHRHLLDQGQRAGRPPVQRRDGGQHEELPAASSCRRVVAGTTRNCMTCPVVAGSATSKSSSGSPPPNGSSGPTLREHVRPSRHAGEVHDDVGALGRCQQQPAAVSPTCRPARRGTRPRSRSARRRRPGCARSRG